MRAHPLFAGIVFDELKIVRENTGDGQVLMKTAGQMVMDATNKTAEERSSLVGSVMSDLSTGESIFEQKSIVSPSSSLEKLKKNES